MRCPVVAKFVQTYIIYNIDKYAIYATAANCNGKI